ncbi:MAG: pyrroloquinoline quinone biosynthesis protein C [Acidobacteria bacterium]|nr:pyrroloquinoline quinone biosynthesis protein C [Acidobacteriota bacterium]
MNETPTTPWTREEFELQLRGKEKYYHANHEFHVLMHSWKLDKTAIQGWVANRFYYQVAIPVKDAAVMSNCWDREIRREWIKRIIDHDGAKNAEGGIEAWLQLGEAVGLTRDELWSQQHLLPGVKFAIDAYVNFARHQPWEIAAASSLTELFAPTIHQRRLDNWPKHYPWISEQGYNYFRKRLSEARRDVVHGLNITLDYCETRRQQEAMLEVLQFKLDVLWTMLDCMWMAYVEHRPPYHNIA